MRSTTLLPSILAAALASAGCGRELVPIPVPCPPCIDTSESLCREFELSDGTRLRSQYSPGDPNLPLLIVVHGLGGSYENVTLSFPKGEFPALSFSLPGYLCSDELPEGTAYSIAVGSEALERLMEYHQDLLTEFGAGHTLVLGASFGGFIVADYFARHPESRMSAVMVISQDTPPDPAGWALFDSYLKALSALFPLVDNRYMQQYLASARDFDVSTQLAQTTNRWLLIAAADDTVLTNTAAMAQRLGARARYVEFPGDHLEALSHTTEVRQIVLDNLEFLVAD